jgi:hypothetical protein
MNFNRLISTKIELKGKEDELCLSLNVVKEKEGIIDSKEQVHQEDLMLNEDHVCQIFYKS